jgi:hypothetical protein
MDGMQRHGLKRAVELVKEANSQRQALQDEKAGIRTKGKEWPGDGTYEQHLERTLAQMEGALRDADLLYAYQTTSGEEGDEDADLLCTEIERRGLDV